VLMAETENDPIGDTPLVTEVEEIVRTKVGGSIGEEKISPEPSTPSTSVVDEPVKPSGDVDGLIMQTATVSHSNATCCVQGCDIVAVDGAEEIGTWCEEHEDRLIMMVNGDVAGYPSLEYYPALAGRDAKILPAGRQAWLRFSCVASSSSVECIIAKTELLLQGEQIA
jgi:hypothetical protein